MAAATQTRDINLVLFMVRSAVPSFRAHRYAIHAQDGRDERNHARLYAGLVIHEESREFVTIRR